ncbi:MAG: inositol monophosphatase [Bacteroidetes bacterium]|nr:inositol monophosphatase [Bacteroidota bacterium]
MIQNVVEIAREAGQFLRERVGHVRSVERKSGQDTNLVTEVDRASEALIKDRIRALYPSHAVLGEESGGSLEGAETVWIIDPLDGTTNFTHGLPIFCVSIGVQHRGELVAGAVYDPNLDELFSAEKGSGAFLNGQRLRVSEESEVRNSLLVTGFPYTIRENPDHAIEHFTTFLKQAQAVRRLGSAALDLCYVAAGRFDGFWEVSLNSWDMAAGMLVVREAGGRVMAVLKENL